MSYELWMNTEIQSETFKTLCLCTSVFIHNS